MHLDWNLLASGLLKQAVSGGAVVKSPYPATAKKNTAGELLMQGYAAYNRYIAEHADWHVAGYHFPGGEEGFPLEMLPRLLEGYGPRVTCNEAFCILPKKSVAFVAELTQDEKVRCAGICAGCSQIRCPNRMGGDLVVQ